MGSTSLITVSQDKNITINIDDNESFIITEEQYNDIKNVIKNNFNDEEAIMFIENFFMYMKYGSDCQEFIVDFNDVWKWCDFTRKDHAKVSLIKKFKENEDYIIKDNTQSCENIIPINRELDLNSNKFDRTNSGEKIYLKIDIFEQFCMLAGTEKAKRIRKFYIKMKNIFFKLIINRELFKIKEDIKSYTNNIDFEKSQVYFINIGKKTNKDGFICRDKNNKVIEGNKTIIKYGRQGLKTGRQPVHIKKYENYNLIDSLFTNKPIDLETYATRLSKMKGLWCKIENPKEYNGEEYLAIDSQYTYNNFIININEKCLEINNKFLIEDKTKDDNNIELKKLDIELRKEEEKTKQMVGVEESKFKQKQEETKQEELKLKEKELDFKMMCIQNGLIHLIDPTFINKQESKIKIIPEVKDQEIIKEPEESIEIISDKASTSKPIKITEPSSSSSRRQITYFSSKYTGVRGKIEYGRTFYEARVKDKQKYIFLGHYETEDLAGYAYDCKKRDLNSKNKTNDIKIPLNWEWNSKLNRLIQSHGL